VEKGLIAAVHTFDLCRKQVFIYPAQIGFTARKMRLLFLYEPVHFYNEKAPSQNKRGRIELRGLLKKCFLFVTLRWQNAFLRK
jgi:fructose-1,6-bisphosphatase